MEGRPRNGQIGILGPVELLGDGPVPLGGVKERCLLAALAVHCGEAVSAASLVDALWGDDPPRTATKTLQNYVLRVRRALARAEGATIATLPDGYCLRAALDATDAGLAESLIAEARRQTASGDPAAAARLLRQALGLWRGSALGEFADRPFAAAEAMRLEELREAALEDLFDAELALGHHHEVVGGLEALVTSGPLRERRWGQLMLALYRDGRQAEALDAFGRLRQILAQDLGVDPGAELRRLHQAILQQSPRLGWRPPPRPTAGRGYFGRDREMSRLLRRFDEAAAGRGGVARLAGEPGIGKSHALQLLADQARTSSAIVLAGRCVEGAWAPPFRPFAEAMAGYGELVGPQQLRADLGLAGPALARIAPRLRELLPDLTPPSALQPDEEQFRLLDAAAQFFTAVSARAPVLLVLDDLQWADAGTAMMLRHVARSCGHRRLLLAGAYRTTELTTQNVLGDVLGAMQAETECTVIRLRALGAAAIGQLVAAEAGLPVSSSLAVAIAGHTGGNPFFAKEMIRHMLEERALGQDGSGALEASLPLVAVPEGVRQVIARRFARLSGNAERVAVSASGFAGPFLFPVAAVAASLGDQAALAALDELLAAGLIRPAGAAERYEFVHALGRQAIYDTLSPSRQARLHRRLAQALEAARQRVPACAEPAEIVAQYAHARYAVGAIYGRRDSVPAEAAQDPTVLLYLLGGLRSALPLFEEAAEQARIRGELAREVHCRASIARALAALGDLDSARAALSQTRELARRIPATGWSWERIHVEGARDALALATGEDWTGILAMFDELVCTEDPVPRWARAPMSAGCARTAAHLGQPERAMALLALPVRALARAPAWALNYTRTAADTAETLWLLERRDHLRSVESALRLKALPADFRFPMMDLRLSMARLCAVDGLPEEAVHWFGQARSVLEEQGARPLRAITDFDEALMHARLGRPASARPLLEAAACQFQRIGMTGWQRRAEQLAALLS